MSKRIAKKDEIYTDKKGEAWRVKSKNKGEVRLAKEDPAKGESEIVTKKIKEQTLLDNYKPVTPETEPNPKKVHRAKPSPAKAVEEASEPKLDDVVSFDQADIDEKFNNKPFVKPIELAQTPEEKLRYALTQQPGWVAPTLFELENRVVERLSGKLTHNLVALLIISAFVLGILAGVLIGAVVA